MRRLLAGLALTLLASVAPVAHAVASPAGPRIAVTQLNGFSSSALVTFGPGGSEGETLFGSAGRRYPVVEGLSAPSWSPDGSTLAITAIVGVSEGRSVSSLRTQIATVPAAGGRPELVKGTRGGGEPVFSPDGLELAYAKERRRYRRNDHGGVDLTFRAVATWVVSLRTGAARRLTPWRNGLEEEPSSFTPDGAVLALTRSSVGRAPEATTIPVSGGPEQILVGHALDPVFSPDGHSLVFLRGPRRTVTREHRTPHSKDTSTSRFRLTNLFVRDMADGAVRRLTSSSRVIDAIPRWDPSGRVLAYTELTPLRSKSSSLGFGDAVKTINADGTCAATLLRAPAEVALVNGDWEPGVGREATPAAC